jgi:hypothetical protein
MNEEIAPILIFGFVLAFIAYRQWLREQRRRMVHRERLAALEKGVEPPPYPDEPVRNGVNTKRVLYLSGWIWLAVGIGSMIAGRIVLADPAVRALQDVPPPSMYWMGLVPALVGVAHLVAYAREK